jgi:hypothetical protein
MRELGTAARFSGYTDMTSSACPTSLLTILQLNPIALACAHSCRGQAAAQRALALIRYQETIACSS